MKMMLMLHLHSWNVIVAKIFQKKIRRFQHLLVEMMQSNQQVIDIHLLQKKRDLQMQTFVRMEIVPVDIQNIRMQMEKWIIGKMQILRVFVSMVIQERLVEPVPQIDFVLMLKKLKIYWSI